MKRAAPLLWLGLYDAPERLDAAEVDRRLAAAGSEGRAVDIVPSRDFASYGTAFDQVKALIAV